ncbi:MAG: MFS transporter, partial [Mariprofundaceae bacterium]|nr:MFS transporter [Mariprofundaceae bacterium]
FIMFASLVAGVLTLFLPWASSDWLLAVLMLLTAFSARGFPDREIEPEPVAGQLKGVSSSLLWLLLAGFLMQASHGAYYGFFSLYLLQAGYSGWQVGCFWVLGVLAEIVLMWQFSRPVAAASPRLVLTICLLLASLRWLGMGLSTELVWLLLLQLLHAASFAAFHINGVTWVQRLAPRHRRASAQGWYSACGFGLGTAVGIMACGWIATQAGGEADFSSAFVACAVVAFIGVAASLRLPRTV